MSAQPGEAEVRYRIEVDGATLERYICDGGRYVIIIGPRGSGKSRASIKKLAFNAARQPVSERSGRRHRRTLAIRQTYGELKSTTVDAVLTDLPEQQWGKFYWDKPYKYEVRAGGLEWDIDFVAVEDERALKKLLSTNYSDVWINEGREVPRRVFDDADAVIGRFPPDEDGGAFLPQVISDTNPPPATHWMSVMAELAPMPDNLSKEELARFLRPANWKFYVQPPWLFEEVDADGEVIGYRDNPAAENRAYIPDKNYARNMLQGKTRNWVRINLLNKPAQAEDGKPVWPEYREDLHIAKEPLEPLPGHTVFIGVDFGRQPAAVMGQRVFDRWRILRELVAEDMAAKAFAGFLKRSIAEWFPGLPTMIIGDPAGEALSQANEASPFLEFAAAGLTVYPCYTNDPVIRRDTVKELLQTAPEGAQRLLVSPRCHRLRAAMAGDYQYKKLRVRGFAEDGYSPEPMKNRASHVADALQYLLLGAGEGRAMLQPARAAPVQPASMQPRERGWSRLGRGWRHR